MNAREARRLAFLIACDDLSRGLDTSDEWRRHPETDRLFSRDEMHEVTTAARKLISTLEMRAMRLQGSTTAGRAALKEIP